MKLITEVSLTKFLNTSLNLNYGIYDFKVYRKATKQPTHWSMKIPERYKHNVILGDCINHASSNFREEMKSISHKYFKTDSPKH